MLGRDPQTWYTKLGLGRAGSYVTPWSKTGYNSDVGVTTEDMWVYGGPYVWPALGAQLECVSTGAQDTGAGTGVQQVRISYLTPAYVEASEIVTLTGAAPVATVANNIFRIQSFRAYRVGGNAVAAGNIDIRMIGGPATVYSRIGTGFTRARNNCWTVPAGKTLYVTSIAFSSGSAAAGKNVLFTTRATYDDASGRALGPNFFMPYHEIQLQDQAWERALEIPTRLPAQTDIKVSALSDSAGALCTSVLRGFVVTG